MLKLIDITKEYQTGDLHQVALRNVSIAFGDKGLTSILGPSGSGKSTLLNIIGGLDRYDSGDLVINNVSTKEYSDRDWDSYRNHTIGFIFQSYNLIPHQTVLANVELALTISGVSSSEKRKRSMEALDKVGLADQYHKKPNQLSGGQMQRVAIARALVADPDILLADEPTGALDTKTSVQIMDLLKELSKDRLVIMVTHNPDLAEEYSDRIIELKDGEITKDSNPFIVEDSQDAKYKNLGRASMSFLTSLALSFNNLVTKKGRTILTAFAGSIGIIGIALILSLSNGANLYIQKIQEDTLSEYPLHIFESGMDLTSLMTEGMGVGVQSDETKKNVSETQLLKSFLSGTTVNDLKSLKEFIEEGNEIKQHAISVEYTYNVKPVVYRFNQEEQRYRKINPDDTFNSISGGNNPLASLMNMSASMAQFNPLPKEESLYKPQYTVVEGRWPEKYNELVLIVAPDNSVTDYTLYLLGLKDDAELDEIVKKYFAGEKVDFAKSTTTYEYSQFLDVDLRLVDVSSLYEYDKDRNIYINKEENKEYINGMLKDAEKLKIVGIVKPSESATASMLSLGLAYTPELDEYVMQRAAKDEMVLKQMENKDINIFTGKEFGEENDLFSMEDMFSVDENAMSNAFGFDANAMNLNEDMFKNFDFSDISLDLSTMNLNLSSFGSLDLNAILKDINVKVSQDGMRQMFESMSEGYIAYASQDPSTNYSALSQSLNDYMSSERARTIIRDHINSFLSKIPVILPTYEETRNLIVEIMQGYEEYLNGLQIDSLENLGQYINEYLESEYVTSRISQYVANFEAQVVESKIDEDTIDKIIADLYADYNVYAQENALPQPSKLIDSFASYLQTEDGQRRLNEGISVAVNADEISAQLEKNLSAVMATYSEQMQSAMQQVFEQIGKSIAEKMTEAMTQMMQSLQTAFYFNPEAFANAIDVDLDADSMQEMIMSLMQSSTTSYEDNLVKLNYATEDKPNSISIYPKDFENKTKIIKVLEKYNKKMEDSGQKEKVIVYSDTVATLMSSVTSIVDTISYVLIAFVAISLVVSSIMIGIITYISVLERTREIGILRALGASKKNISQVFSAETFIIGLLAGVFGIILSIMIIIPANKFIHEVLDAPNVTAVLPVSGAIILIILSTVLTLIGGIIPSRSASKKDPVIALRTE